MNELTHIDLFSGIGGFALAARWAGIKTVQFVEIDKFCHKVLKKNFPGVPIHDDIKTFTNTDRPKDDATQNNNRRGKSVANNGAEVRSFNSASSGTNRPFLLTGGFPCQPFSCAGKRQGTSDSRHLWPHMLRVIKEFKPKWIIGENVPGIINIKGMEQQDSESELESETFNDGSNSQPSTVLIGILNDLEQAGYSVQVFIILACAVNAPHRRDRVWILGRRQDADDTEGRGCGLLHTKDIGQTSVQVNAPSVPDSHAPDTKKSKCEQPGRTRTGREGFTNRSSWDEPWLEVATRLCRMDDGVSQELYKLETSDRVARLKALGNAIVPQVAFEIMKAIVAMELEGE